MTKIKKEDYPKIVEYRIKNKYTLEIIGRIYGVTRERIRQILDSQNLTSDKK